MDNLSTLTMQPKTLVVKGREYKVHPLDLGDFGYLQEWIDRQFPSPFKAVKEAFEMGGFTFEQQKYMLKNAVEQASRPRHLIGTFEADELLTSVEGYKQVIFLSIRKGDPSFTEKDAEALFSELSFVDIAQISQASNLDMVASDPKEDGLNTTPLDAKSGSAGNRRQRRSAPKRTGGKSTTTR
jgi:hypothetical protein